MQYIIPDIHGHLWEFEAMLDEISLTTDDELFLLGDYIDRGPDSRAVVDRVMELVNSEYKVTALRGNHEQMFIDGSDHLEEYAVMSNKRKLPFCDENKKVIPLYREFFESLPIHAETEELFLSHAGVNFRTDKPFEDTHSMLWMREIRYVPEEYPKTIIHGHNPMSLGVIIAAIEEQKPFIPLDNGVYMKKYEAFGNLLCLEWTNKSLFHVNSKNHG